MSPNLLRIIILQNHLCTTYNHHITSHHRAHNSILPLLGLTLFFATTKHYHHPSPSSNSDTTFCPGFSRQNTKPRNQSLCDKANQFHYILDKKKKKEKRCSKAVCLNTSMLSESPSMRRLKNQETHAQSNFHSQRIRNGDSSSLFVIANKVMSQTQISEMQLKHMLS